MDDVYLYIGSPDKVEICDNRGNNASSYLCCREYCPGRIRDDNDEVWCPFRISGGKIVVESQHSRLFTKVNVERT